jgi:nucleoside-diphosphate-sugar epimerase
MLNNKIIQEDLEFITTANIPWYELEGKTILISGANGFLPAYMVGVILHLNETKFEKKAKVIALVRNIEKAQKRFADYIGLDDLYFLVQDVCESININEKLDFIIHAASQASPKYYGVDPVGTLSANVLGTNNLLKVANQNSIKSFLYFSSSEVYGKVGESKNAINENDYGYLDPLNVRSCYGESKRMGENMCISWMHQYGVPIKIVRPFHIYGPCMSLDDGRVYADFVSDIVKRNDIIMKSDGKANRSFCYLRDATIAFFKVLLEGKIGEAYNVGNPNEYISIIELAEKLIKLFPERKLKIIESPDNTEGYLKSVVLRNCPDLAKLNKLGWSPKVSIEEGFYRTIKSYQ